MGLDGGGSGKTDEAMSDGREWIDHGQDDWDEVITPKEKDRGLTVED